MAKQPMLLFTSRSTGKPQGSHTLARECGLARSTDDFCG